MMYDDDQMLMLSGIQHYMFCPRQWALIHIEQQWGENRLTVEGQSDASSMQTILSIVRSVVTISHCAQSVSLRINWDSMALQMLLNCTQPTMTRMPSLIPDTLVGGYLILLNISMGSLRSTRRMRCN